MGEVVLDGATWITYANDRPAWLVWGKGQPSGSCPAHPLLCHMLDVAAVAKVLLAERSSGALRNRLLSVLPDHAQAEAFLLFLIALHDLGKCTPAFQAKLPWARELLEKKGFAFQQPTNALHHGAIGLPLLTEALCSLHISGAGLGRAHASEDSTGKHAKNNWGVYPTRCDRALAEEHSLPLARAVVAHHGEFPQDALVYERKPGPREHGTGSWEHARSAIVQELRLLFTPPEKLIPRFDHAWIVLLAGLTSVADWIGSMEEVFAYQPPQQDLFTYWDVALERAHAALDRAGMQRVHESPVRSFSQLFPSYTPWSLHLEAEALTTHLRAPFLVLVEAPMGEGKTEAALLLSCAASAANNQQGIFFGLPTQATANQMLGRVETFLQRTHAGAPNLVLAHGEAELVERFQRLKAIYNKDNTHSGVHAERWFLSKKRALLAEYAVGTIDQALLGVLRTPHAFVRLFGLAGKTVVLDEVHAYDTYTSTLLDRLLEWLAALGTSVVLLSATLPSKRRKALVEAYRKGARLPEQNPASVEYPRITHVSTNGIQSKHFTPRSSSISIAVDFVTPDLSAIAALVRDRVKNGGCIGWICNTVDRAQEAYKLLESCPDTERLLLHSRMLPLHRAQEERRLEDLLGPPHNTRARPERCIVVGTQVLEQSLDIDFDVLITELAPIDLLLQRIGRLHRHQRNNRATGHKTPRVYIACPEGPIESVSLREVAVVYGELFLRKTLQAIKSRSALTIPDEIETLVEAVYAHIDVSSDADFLPAAIEQIGKSSAQRQNAEVRLMPRPTITDDPFGDFQVYFDDDENPTLHACLKALTRDASPSVELVCLVRKESQLYLDESCTTPIDLAQEPDPRLTRSLVQRSISVSHKALVSKLTHDASKEFEAPGWAKNALLKHRRFLGFEHGEATVDSTRLVLDPERGLLLQHKPR